MKRFFAILAFAVAFGLVITACDNSPIGSQNETETIAAEATPSPKQKQANADDLSSLCEAVPLDVVQVLDRSGTMGLDPDGDGSTKLDDVKDASTSFVDRLTSSDRTGLVSFDGESPVTVDEPLTANFSDIKTAINGLTAGGGTNVGGAVDAGHGELDANGRTDATPILVVLSNGMANVGPDAVTEAQEAKDAGIRVITIAFGEDADTETLKDMASDPKANNFFTAESATIDDVFKTITQEICPQEVDIDIKPKSDPNSINLNNEGEIPVAVFTTDDFDATNIDPETVRFGAPDLFTNGDSPAELAHEGGHLEDVDGDGRMDFVGHFPTEDAGFESDDEEGWLVGETKDGDSFAGRDAVRILDRGGAAAP